MGVVINFEEAKKLAEKKRKERLENEELGSITDAVLDHDFLLQELYNRLEFYDRALETGNMIYVPNEVFFIYNSKVLKGPIVRVNYNKNANNIIYDIELLEESPFAGPVISRTLGVDAFYTEEDAINSLNNKYVF